MSRSSAIQTPESTPEQRVAESVLLARSSPGGLALATDPAYLYPEHLAVIDETIVAAIAGEAERNIIIEAPPRHGKSWLCSKWLPAWYVGTFPSRRVMFGAYEADFAATWGARARKILTEIGGPIFGIGVDDESRARYRWDVKQSWSPGEEDALDWATGDGGGMLTAGVGGPFTGKGGDLIVIDDPVKNRDEAESEGFREKNWHWFTDAVWTRREPGAVVVVIMARWHEDDLAGRLQKRMDEGGERWTVLRMPALAEDRDMLGRAEGEALWPERYDQKALLGYKQMLGSYSFEGLYQCRPTAPIGGIWKRPWWLYFNPVIDDKTGMLVGEAEHPFRFDMVIESWDMAFKKKSDSDFVVGQLWGRRGAHKYLLAQIRARLTFTETKEALRVLTRWARMAKIPPDAVLVEDKANGTAVLDELRAEISGLVAVEPEGSKEARAHAASAQIETGQVHIPHGTIPAPVSRKQLWKPTKTAEFVGEAASFPRGADDDQVDASSQALRYLSEHGGPSRTSVEETGGAQKSITGDLLNRPM